MALHSKKINYTVYPPNHEPGTVCWDYRTAVKARLAAKKFGPGSKAKHRIELSDGKIIQQLSGESIVEIPVDQITSLRQSRGGWLIISSGDPEGGSQFLPRSLALKI